MMTESLCEVSEVLTSRIVLESQLEYSTRAAVFMLRGTSSLDALNGSQRHGTYWALLVYRNSFSLYSLESDNIWISTGRLRYGFAPRIKVDVEFLDVVKILSRDELIHYLDRRESMIAYPGREDNEEFVTMCLARYSGV